MLRKYIILSCNKVLLVFKCCFNLWALDVQSSPEKLNHLSRTEIENKRTFQKLTVYVTLLDEHLVVFVYGIWADLDLLSKL